MLKLMLFALSPDVFLSNCQNLVNKGVKVIVFNTTTARVLLISIMVSQKVL